MEQTKFRLGSKQNPELVSGWFTLADIYKWKCVEFELEQQGFNLNGPDKELFIKDIEGETFITVDQNTDPRWYYDLLDVACVFDDSFTFDLAKACIEAWGQEAWIYCVENEGCWWSDELEFYNDPEVISSWTTFGKFFRCLHSDRGFDLMNDPEFHNLGGDEYWEKEVRDQVCDSVWVVSNGILVAWD